MDWASLLQSENKTKQQKTPSCFQVVRKGGVRKKPWKKICHSCFLRREVVFYFQNLRKEEEEVHGLVSSGVEGTGVWGPSWQVTSARTPGLSDCRSPTGQMKTRDQQNPTVYLAVNAVISCFWNMAVLVYFLGIDQDKIWCHMWAVWIYYWAGEEIVTEKLKVKIGQKGICF